MNVKNMESLSKDLISISPPDSIYYFHRQLKHMDKNVLHSKTSYTLKDLWEYFYLSSNNTQTPATIHITKEDLEKRRETFLADCKNFTQEEVDFIQNLVVQYGIDTILFAIDEYMASIPEGKNVKYSVLDIEQSITNAQTNVKRLILENKLYK